LTDRDRAWRERDGRIAASEAGFGFHFYCARHQADCWWLPPAAEPSSVLWECPGTRSWALGTGHRAGTLLGAAIFMPGTKKLSNLLGQAVSVVVCITKQVSFSVASSCILFGPSPLIDVYGCGILPQWRRAWQEGLHLNCSEEVAGGNRETRTRSQVRW